MVEYVGIVAMGKNNEIGKGLLMPWWLKKYSSQEKYSVLRSKDLPRLKQFTVGNHTSMGRITYESFPDGARPLPGRPNHVLTSNVAASKKLSADLLNEKKSHLITVHNSFDSLENALVNEEKVFILGGGQIYTHFLPKINTLEVTRINEVFPEADVFFPEFESLGFEIFNSIKYSDLGDIVTSQNDTFFSFDTYVRK